MNAVTRMLPYDMQLSNEYTYSRKHIDRYIREDLLASAPIVAKIAEGAQLLEDWLSKDYYESKNRRLEQLKGLDLTELVQEVLVGMAYVQEPQLFTSVSAQLAGRLGFSDKADAIQTMAEILAVLCQTDCFDITKAGRDASLMIVSRIGLSDRLLKYIENSQYLPPMVCPPKTLTHNRQSGYLTHNDSVILKHYNHHDDDVCLDVLNIQNAVPLSLNEEFLRTVEEQPSKPLDQVQGGELKDPLEVQMEIREKQRQWEIFKQQSYAMYALMIGQGNRFYLTHKVDKRGRIYAQGYHINYQGAQFKKAMVELADKEVVQGVPQ